MLPVTGPLLGMILFTLQGSTYSNTRISDENSLPLFDIANLTVDGSCRGEMQLNDVELMYDAFTIKEPNLQSKLLESRKFLPRTCTIVPPTKTPFDGTIWATKTFSTKSNLTELEVILLST